MSQPQVIPDWSLGWRLRRSLEWGNVSAKEMAGELDVSEGTISRWCHDVGAPPRSIYLRAWAARCRVPLEWLESGDNALAAPRSSHRPRHLQLDHGPQTPTRGDAQGRVVRSRPVAAAPADAWSPFDQVPVSPLSRKGSDAEPRLGVRPRPEPGVTMQELVNEFRKQIHGDRRGSTARRSANLLAAP